MSPGVSPPPPDQVRIGVIGPGRLGQSLVRALVAADVHVIGLAGRASESAPAEPPGRQPGQVSEQVRLVAASLGVPALLSHHVRELSDLVFLTVPDAGISAVVSELAGRAPTRDPRRWQAVVHCSGAVDLSGFAPLVARGWLAGSWHPLQAVPSPDSELRAGITWAITSDDAGLVTLLGGLSRALHGIPRVLPEDAKGRYHAAAVLGSNYVVGLLAQATELLGACGLSRGESLQALIPLARSAIDAVETSGLPDGLTGPLVRGDVGTVATHLGELTAYPEVRAVYQVLGRATLALVQARLPAPIHDEMLDLLGGPADDRPRT